MTLRPGRLTKGFLSALLILVLAGLLIFVINPQLAHTPLPSLAVTLDDQQEWRMQSSLTWTLAKNQPETSQQLISAVSYQTQAIIYLEDPIFIRFNYQTTHDETHIGWANFGEVNNHQLQLIGNVNLVNYPSSQDEPWHLITQQLSYDSEQELIHGDGTIQFDRSTLRQTGRGYVYNLNLDHLTIKDEVNTYYESAQTP
jgi:lipopolysaccharide export system protein LptC